MHYCKEEILLCTSCQHVISSRALLSGYAYRHPILKVLICKSCNYRLNSTSEFDADKLCLWCNYPGKYTRCSKCSSNFCMKCLKNNFNEATYKNITKKKNWTCFHCLPELLSEHTAKCEKVLERMGNNHSLPIKRKRSSSESRVNPSKKGNRSSSSFSSSDDESSRDVHSFESDTKVPSPADYTATKEQIIEKTNRLALLFFEVNQRALKFRNKLTSQECSLKVLQNAFTFKNNLLDATINTLTIWKDELADTDNKWKQDFSISLKVPLKEHVKKEDATDNELEQLNNSNDNGSESFKLEKRKKFRLSLKKTSDTEITDDCMSDDTKEISILRDPELDHDLESEDSMVPKESVKAEKNEVPIIPETVPPDLEDGDSDHSSIFSEKTVVIDFSELQPAEVQEDQCSDSIFNISQNGNDVCGNEGIGEDAVSDSSFVFDINDYGSELPSNTDCSSGAISKTNNLDVLEELNSAVIIGKEKSLCQSESFNDLSTNDAQNRKEKSQNQSLSDMESENETEIEIPTNDNQNGKENSQNLLTSDVQSENETEMQPLTDLFAIETNNVEKSNLETHSNNKVSECDKTLNENAKDHSKSNEEDENLKENNAIVEEHELVTIPNEKNNDDKTNAEIADKHEPAAAPNEKDIIEDENEKSNNEIADNPELNQSSISEPCCSYNTNTERPILDGIDVFSKEMGSDSSFKIDIHENTLVTDDIKDDINDVEVSKSKINFFSELGLYSNIIGTDIDIKEDSTEIDEKNMNNEERSKNIKEAVKLLQVDDFGLFDSDSDTSVTSVSDEEEDSETINDAQEKVIPSLVNKSFPALPTETIFVTTNNNEETIVSKNGNNTEANGYQIKPCSILLKRLEDILSNKSSSISSTEETELREIQRLTNLNNIGLKRRGDKLSKKGKMKKRKVIKPSGSARSESETVDSECDNLSVTIPSILSPTMSDISQGGMLDAFINFAGSTSEFDMESDCEDENKKKKKKRTKRAGSMESNKENQPNNQENDESIPKELTAEELALAEKRKWRNDPLLKTKLADSSSDTDSDETVEGENIVSQKTKIKMEALEKKMEKRNTHKVASSHSSLHKSDNDENESVSTEIDDDIEDDKPSILINTDTDSSIEFISETKQKRKSLRKLSKAKGSVLCISSDEHKTDSEDESVDKKKGRKNIRAILSDEILEEETKRANLIEKQRKDRLNQKQSQLDSIISQSQILSQEEGIILDVNEETQAPLIVVNSRITKRLKKHQKSGVRFMWENCYEGVKQLQKDKGSGCILAHCMGLGKSFQVVALIHTLFANPITNTKHVLLVCPLSIVLNWKNEFKQGLEGIKDNVNINIFSLSDRYSGRERRLFIVDKWREQTGVLIMGYEAYEKLTNCKNSKNLKRQENVKKALVDPGPDLVVLDEGHLLKNGKNIRTRALMQVKTRRRIILTGTPMQNNLKEYYHMVQFVKPNLLGSYLEYTNRFVNPITNGQYHDSTEEDFRRMKKRSHVLFKMLKDTVQRFEVTELEPYLPSKFDFVLFIQPHIIQAQLYEKYLDLIKTETGDVKGNLINNFHKLHLLWTHPCLLYLRQEQKKSQKKSKEVDVMNFEPEIIDADEFPEGWWHQLCPDDYRTNIEYGPKFKVMLAIIREAEKVGDKLLIFSNSIIELDAIESFLQQHATPTSQWESKKDYYRMDGTVIPDVRLQLCDSFNDKNNTTARVFLISNRVGGLGLNLVAANRVILMDVNWNPAYDIQSVFRIYRFGQTKQCYIYRLVSMGTMEEVVYQRQINKLALAGRVVDEQQISRHYKSDDLQKMYRLQYNIEQERPSLAIPPDMVLATVLQECEEIFQYHEHQSLLENKPEEELDENEMKLAWDEFNRENENHKQIEEQKRRLSQSVLPGPSAINPFLPRTPGPPNLKIFQNNLNFNIPMQPTTGSSHYGNVYSAKPKDTAAQPGFEVVLIQEDNAARATPTTQNLAQSSKPNELSKQFYHYIKQFSQKGETSTDIQKSVGSVEHASMSNTPTNTQAPSYGSVVIPQIVNSFTQSPQTPVNRNVGYVLPKAVASFGNTGRYNTPLVRNSPLSKNKKYPTTNTSSNSSMGNSNLNNSQTIKKTQIANVQSAVNVNKINQTAVPLKNSQNNKPIAKTQAVSRNTEQQLSASTSTRNTFNPVRLPKNVGNTKRAATKNVQGMQTAKIPTNTKPSLKKKQKSGPSQGVIINDNFNEIIDVDSDNTMVSLPNQINGRNGNKTAQEQELISTLHKNSNITLSLRDKPTLIATDVSEIAKPNLNTGGHTISISAIARTKIQPNPNDVIEID